MAFQRPSLTTLKDRAATDIQSRLPGTDARLRRSILAAIANAASGAAHGMHGHLAWNAEQILPDNADEEMLLRHANQWLKEGRKAATAAQGNILFGGVNGTNIPAGTVVQRSDGWQFTTNNIATIASGTATVAVTSTTTGVDGNSAANSSVSLVTPIAGINSAATVSGSGLTGGADIESLDSLRDRIRYRIQNPPHGGADFDYVTWAREVPNVTRAWCFPGENGLGTVVVRFMMDDLYSGGIPLAGDVTTVQTHINTVRPVAANVTVAAPAAKLLNLTIQLTPGDAAVKAAVEAELKDMLRREAEPGGTILITHIREAISIAAGEIDHVLVSPTANVTHTAAQIAVLGVITWQ